MVLASKALPLLVLASGLPTLSVQVEWVFASQAESWLVCFVSGTSRQPWPNS